MTRSPDRADALSDAEIQRSYCRRIGVFVVTAFAAVALLLAALWTVGALQAVDAAESERDGWQRPADVIEALSVGDGKVVADLGSGVGYFALKLAERVGRRGRVLAVDVRPFPLLFLKLRGLVRGRFNLTVVRGESGDPHLPAAGVDAILVANTFHELEDPDAVLAHAREALRPGGRLVVVDPDAGAAEAGAPAHQAHRHTSPDQGEARILHAEFDIVSRYDAFVDDPRHGRWWLIVARRP